MPHRPTSPSLKLHITNRSSQGNTGQAGEGESDSMRPIYLQCDLVCFYSLLTLILRAIPASGDSLSSVSDECVAVARDALDIHQQCIEGIRGFKNDPFMVTRYLNWSVGPFIRYRSYLFQIPISVSTFRMTSPIYPEFTGFPD
jgi:hypothetical protein